MNVHSINTVATRTVRGRPRIDDKRRMILDAALHVFAERGYHGTAVPEVAHAAKVSTGTLYHYFESKELLVNEVYRDAKARLRSTLLDELPELDPYQMDHGRAWFTALWTRLGAFAQTEPDAFRFLEMQDHTPYLDNESKQLELSVLAPLWLEGKRLTDRVAGEGDAPPVDVAIALLWGAFVGLIKASRLGYLTLDERSLARAGAACWRIIAPQLPRATEDTRTAAARPTAARVTAARVTAPTTAGRATAGRATAGRATAGRATAGRATAGRATAGRATEGRATTLTTAAPTTAARPTTLDTRAVITAARATAPRATAATTSTTGARAMTARTTAARTTTPTTTARATATARTDRASRSRPKISSSPRTRKG